MYLLVWHFVNFTLCTFHIFIILHFVDFVFVNSALFFNSGMFINYVIFISFSLQFCKISHFVRFKILYIKKIKSSLLTIRFWLIPQINLALFPFCEILIFLNFFTIQHFCSLPLLQIYKYCHFHFCNYLVFKKYNHVTQSFQ